MKEGTWIFPYWLGKEDEGEGRKAVIDKLFNSKMNIIKMMKEMHETYVETAARKAEAKKARVGGGQKIME